MKLQDYYGLRVEVKGLTKRRSQLKNGLLIGDYLPTKKESILGKGQLYSAFLKRLEKRTLESIV